MVAIYICSTETCAGKTALAIGLARTIAKRGGKVAYFKPVSVADSSSSRNHVDRDVSFAKEVLALGDSLEVLSPVSLAPRTAGSAVKPELMQRIRDSFAAVARGKDVVIAEGPPAIDDGAEDGLSAAKVAETLGARVLLVVRYRGDATVRRVSEAAAVLGREPAAVVLNAVPKEQLAYARNEIIPEIERGKVPVIGLIPLERGLLGSSVRELVDHLGGGLLCCHNSLDATIEGVMIGARSFSSGLPYFNRRTNKAVVTGADRPDIQLAALETPTRCLIVTGDGDVNPLVIERAAEVQVPLIKVDDGTTETIEKIEQLLARVRFHQARKTEGLVQLIEANLDSARSTEALGLPKA